MASELPKGRDANATIAEVVVAVDEHARRGGAPNNDESPSADVHPLHQSQKQHIHLLPPLVFYLETRAHSPFSPDIGTKFCLDVRCYDP